LRFRTVLVQQKLKAYDYCEPTTEIPDIAVTCRNQFVREEDTQGQEARNSEETRKLVKTRLGWMVAITEFRILENLLAEHFGCLQRGQFEYLG